MLAVLTVNAIFDQDGIVNDGTLTLREAIAYVNQTAIAESQDGNQIVGIIGQNDLIVFDQSLSGKTIALGIDSAGNTITFPGFENGELDITESVIIDATMLSNGITVDASSNDLTPNSTLFDGNPNNDGDGSSVLNIELNPGAGENAEVALIGLTITGGDVSRFGMEGDVSDGGGVRFVAPHVPTGSSAKLTIRDSTITGNFAGGQGGGVFAFASKPGSSMVPGGNVQIDITDSLITGNGADNGGGVSAYLPGFGHKRADGFVFTMQRTVVESNSATDKGGGVFVLAV